MWAPLRKDDDLLDAIARYWIQPSLPGIYLPNIAQIWLAAVWLPFPNTPSLELDQSASATRGVGSQPKDLGL